MSTKQLRGGTGGERSEELVKWATERDELAKTPPKAGDILTAFGDSLGQINIEISTGQQPFLYAQVAVPDIVGVPLGWYLQTSEADSRYGWKCILLPKAATEVITKKGLVNTSVEVYSLRVVKMSKSGKSLLVEIAEWDRPVVAEPVEKELVTA